MKVRLAKSTCAGHALCHAVDEDLFPLDDEGYSALQDRDVTSGDEQRIRLGVESCPEKALIVEDSSA